MRCRSCDAELLPVDFANRKCGACDTFLPGSEPLEEPTGNWRGGMLLLAVVLAGATVYSIVVSATPLGIGLLGAMSLLALLRARRSVE